MHKITGYYWVFSVSVSSPTGHYITPWAYITLSPLSHTPLFCIFNFYCKSRYIHLSPPFKSLISVISMCVWWVLIQYCKCACTSRSPNVPSCWCHHCKILLLHLHHHCRLLVSILRWPCCLTANRKCTCHPSQWQGHPKKDPSSLKQKRDGVPHNLSKVTVIS